MYIASTSESEQRETLEVMIRFANGLENHELQPRQLLAESGFSRAEDASDASLKRVVTRMEALLPFIQELPDLSPEVASARVNEELTEIEISPSIVDHGGFGPHVHWTPATAKFDDQILADILMALAYEICDNGTIRFGRCGAEDCSDLFYDATRNRSKRFCADPRCASRTHTADHRARLRQA